MRKFKLGYLKGAIFSLNRSCDAVRIQTALKFFLSAKNNQAQVTKYLYKNKTQAVNRN